jgi:ubiquinone/menaquinone biosynthesis C-methylase UbiE
VFSESAELYDAIYSSFKNYSAEAERIATLVRTTHPGAQRMLDVGCGTGEHAMHLRARHGFLVDGLDIDPGLVAFARQKVPDGEFVVADMSSFDLRRQYDVVVCMFSSIGYLKTISRVTAAFQCFRRHLRPNGVAIVEPWFPPGVLRVGKGTTRRGETNGIRVERTSHTAVTGNISTLTFTYRVESAAGTRTASEVHELGLFTPAEMLGSFSEAGLTATHDPVGLFDNRGLYVARALAEGS